MMRWKMKVIDEKTGRALPLAAGAIRYVGLLASAAVLMIGLFWAVFDARKQGWHDKLAGSLVVYWG